MVEQHIDGEVFVEIKSVQMKELGLTIGQTTKLLRHIRALNDSLPTAAGHTDGASTEATLQCDTSSEPQDTVRDSFQNRTYAH